MKAKRKSTRTPAKRQAELFIASVVASKAGEIPADCRLPDTVEGIEAGRRPAPKQREQRN